jgi:hypothetical protein
VVLITEQHVIDVCRVEPPRVRLVAARRAKNNKKAAKFCFWMFLGMIAFAVLMEWLKAQ